MTIDDSSQPPSGKSQPIPPAPSLASPAPWPPREAHRHPRRRWPAVILSILLFGSVLVNLAFLATLGAEDSDGMEMTLIRSGKDSQTIALYTIDGIIDGPAAARFAKLHDRIVGDDNVKALVIRVESPGGGVAEADRMYECLRRLRSKGKTVVVSMGGVAASGGYYVSAAADMIIAEPTTVTGSIGVLSAWVMLRGTFEKLGAEMVILKSTHARGWKDAMSPFRRPDERELAHLQGILDTIQDRFEQIVTDGRGDRLTTRKVPPYTITVGEGEQAETVTINETEPFNGKVYLAADAKDLGLVDEIGYHETAIERAGELAGLTDPKVVRYSRRRSLWTRLLEARGHSGLQIGGMLDELQSPRLQLIWKID